MTGSIKAWVGSEPLICSEWEAFVATTGSGATVTFIGTVRDEDHGRDVIELEYEAHPNACVMLEEILRDCCNIFGEVRAAAAAHRTGLLQVSEVAFIACVSSPHRQEGFAACQWIVDAVKERLPVWKRQIFANGGREWVNAQ